MRTWRTRRLLARAWRAVLSLDIPAALHFTIQLERENHTTTALRAALLALQDDATAALAQARLALQAYADVESRALAVMICRWAYWRAGELNEFRNTVRAEWRAGLHRCQAITTIFDLNLEAAVEFGRLRLAVSRKLAAEALERARSTASSESAAGLLSAALLTQVAYEEGQLEEAGLAIRNRMSVIRTSATVECVTLAYLILARLAQRSDSALTLLREAQALGERRRWPRLIAAMLAERIRILVDDNEEAEAAASLEELEALLRSQQTLSASARADLEFECELARLRVRQHRIAAAQAASAAESLRQKALARSDLRLALEIHLVAVAAYARCGEVFEAQARLMDALDVGATHGLCMTFVDAGPVVRKLLDELCHDPSISDDQVLELRPYMHTLLVRYPASARPTRSVRRASLKPLTPREGNVLRLIATGLSNKRIAQRLDIAPETVKSHTKNIFMKLAAQTRAQAVAQGEALGLIHN